MKNQSSPATGLKGFVKVDVVDHEGRVIREGRWQPNLLLDQGLDKLATTVYCDLFKWGVKGNSAQAMREVPNAVNKYTLNTSTGTLTRTAPALDSAANARLFVDGPASAGGDLLKTVRSANGIECVIVGFTSTTTVQVVPVGGDRSVSAFTAYGAGSSPAVATQTITIYNTGLQGIEAEAGRTDSYSTVAGENSTTTAANVRTFQRTFLFDPEPENSEVVASPNVYGWVSQVVTRSAGTRNFTADDVGKYILFPDTGEYCKITQAPYATTDTSTPPVTTTFPTKCAVDRAPIASHVGLPIKLYGYNSYSHIGFSDSGDIGDNLNILIRLENSSFAPIPVLALGSNPEVPGQQVKVTYKFVLTFTPNTIVTVGSLFGGDVLAMGSTTRAGTATIENLATSIVAGDGGTDIGSLGLEPCYGGYVGLSAVALALDVLGGTTNPPDRSPGVQYTELTPDDYTPGEYTRTYTGTFDINSGNTSSSTGWRSLGLFDIQNNTFLYTMLFAVAQKKPPTHQLTLHFRKSWNRDLS